jgi:hypothetical protein
MNRRNPGHPAYAVDWIAHAIFKRIAPLIPADLVPVMGKGPTLPPKGHEDPTSWEPDYVLGCGFFGCVYDTGRSDVVVKVTEDVAEVSMAEIQIRRRLPGVVPYLMVRKIRMDGEPWFVLWRKKYPKSALVSPSHKLMTKDVQGALFAYMSAGQRIGNAARGPRALTKQALLAIKAGSKDRRAGWAAVRGDMAAVVRAISKLERGPVSVGALGRTLRVLWEEEGVVMSDAHPYNFAAVRGKLVILDPGGADWVGKRPGHKSPSLGMFTSAGVKSPGIHQEHVAFSRKFPKGMR